MGMESFFINIQVDKIIDLDSRLNILKQEFEAEKKVSYFRTAFFFKKKIISEDMIVVNHYILLSCYVESEKTTISLEACHSNYYRNIDEMFKIAKTINNQYGRTKIVYADEKTLFESLSQKEFVKWVENCNQEKRKSFIDSYGDMKINLLPEDFYDYVRKNKIAT